MWWCSFRIRCCRPMYSSWVIPLASGRCTVTRYLTWDTSSILYSVNEQLCLSILMNTVYIFIHLKLSGTQYRLKEYVEWFYKHMIMWHWILSIILLHCFQPLLVHKWSHRCSHVVISWHILLTFSCTVHWLLSPVQYWSFWLAFFLMCCCQRNQSIPSGISSSEITTM